MPSPRSSKRPQRSGVDAVQEILTRAAHGSLSLLSRERIQESLEQAVERGRVTRQDANELLGELLQLGREQASAVLADVERLLDEGGHGDVVEAARSALARVSPRRPGRDASTGAGTSARARPRTGASSGARGATSTRRSPIAGYDQLTAAEVRARLGDLSDARLRALRKHERANANRKTVLAAIDRQLARVSRPGRGRRASR